MPGVHEFQQLNKDALAPIRQHGTCMAHSHVAGPNLRNAAYKHANVKRTYPSRQVVTQGRRRGDSEGYSMHRDIEHHVTRRSSSNPARPSGGRIKYKEATTTATPTITRISLFGVEIMPLRRAMWSQ